MTDKKKVSKARKILPFNPLDKRHLGESVGQAMLRQPVTSLSSLGKFDGAGLYAIYYQGDFPAYASIAHRNRQGEFRAPIYVGKAVPKGARKGTDLEGPPGSVLYKRIMQHKRSIEEAENLNLEDFHCRYLVVDDIWIPLGESLLIAKFSPLWNQLVDGFGNHDPGRGRREGIRPRWDTLHPGRSWANNFPPRPESQSQLVQEIEDYLRNNPPPEDTTMITT
ncbi:Eco29kI family restriction endonuclease [Natronospirillum operosum]|uniref:Eco29kI family restriction endonuclease n=1 Tax=Natronospirillum operosum TaxID=2759953 RepID=A0A4Z0W6D9_9GAMM|nr:Eco29kI family restriction endonuclease [Natronospirillum operosum]TGG89406.1 Eco29kI family restriction endonuclease [Natronospirillum operosum]